MSSSPSHVAREIRRQPDAWTQAIDMLPRVVDLLPAPGERVAVLGCGTSWYMAIAYAALREAAGQGETDAFAASLAPNRPYDRIVVISRSGTTTEVLRAMAATSSPVVGITAVPGLPVAERADHAVVLDFADEQSVVQTLFASTTLMLLRASLGERLEPVIAQARAVLERADELPAADASQYSFVGAGWAYGIALEAGLKMREAAQLWTESYPQLEYRHGPIAIAEPGRAVWAFGDAAPGLAADVAATGAEFVDDDLDPVADLVRAQLLAVRRAERLGLDPDRPRHLTRSVVLEDA
ncbi:MAG TPA: sugar isomerase [Jatrophihabitans sp.]|nr:sugar isomerase [Jatrophihabitans sp.]